MNYESRSEYLDMAKGFGIFLVVMVHLFGTVQVVDPAPYKDLIAHFGNSCALTIFFLVSGILLYLKKEQTGSSISFTNFIKKKSAALLYPYCTFSILYFIHEYIRYQFDPSLVTKKDLSNILLDTLTLKGASVLWFFSALFFAEIFFHLLIKHLNPIMMTSILLVSAILIFLYAPILYQPFFQKNVPAKILGNVVLVLLRGMLTCAYLMLGYWMGAFLTKLQKSKVNSIICTIAGIILLTTDLMLCMKFEGVDYNRMIFGVWYIYALCSVIGCIGIILICKGIPTCRLFTCLGRNSLLIMVTHLDFGILRNALSFAYAMNTKITHCKVLFLYGNIFLFVIVFEVISIFVIKKFLPFLYQAKRK